MGVLRIGDEIGSIACAALLIFVAYTFGAYRERAKNSIKINKETPEKLVTHMKNFTKVYPHEVLENEDYRYSKDEN